MTSDGYLPVGLLRSFYWLDDGIQNYLRSRGWPTLPRTQSMIMMNVISGVDRPADIARNLGITRQAVHLTLTQMADQNLLTLEEIPGDKRSKRVVLTKWVEPLRREARTAVELLSERLTDRLGVDAVATLNQILKADWGPPITFEDE